MKHHIYIKLKLKIGSDPDALSVQKIGYCQRKDVDQQINKLFDYRYIERLQLRRVYQPFMFSKKMDP